MLLELGVIPIINENDSSAVEEIKFGDNDKLAALISSLVESDLLVILTDTDGFYDKDPSSRKDARLISFIDRITPDIEKLAGGIGYKFGSGGMKSKLTAAKICMLSGIPMVIANSRKHGILSDLLDGKDIGTLFASGNYKRLKSMKRWIAFGMRSKGSIMLDKGAEKAVKQKGKSILAVGISRVEGDFNKGDTLKVMTHDNRLLAKGISNFSSKDVKKILGKNREKILSQFGPDMCLEVIHRDCLVVFEDE
jgi:glutamate 5-kinase